ncbi:MAG TPA: M23 family metallopeptidase [Actinomycetota bacterium]|nr:M23 family metallopeptidase [Actinomycetota bacterium]
MRNAARIVLAVVVAMATVVVLPRWATGGFVPEAAAQLVPVPTPTLPDILPSPSDTPTDTPTDDPPDPPDDPKDPPDDPVDPPGDGPGGGPGPGDPPSGGPGGTTPDVPGDGGGNGGPDRGGERGDRGGSGSLPGAISYEGLFRLSGSFSTQPLVSVANELRALGWPTERIVRRVYAPFIIGGPANWVNTWGAPRYGPAPGQVRTHEGQDVFCEYGDPVLAAERGTVEFGDGGLGGKIARLYRPDGSYWYYAHLSDWNTRDFSNGDAVRPGDIIGYCGNTGNALTTPPHVHFGWYAGSGAAQNPMRPLVTWLHDAEKRVLGVVSHATRQRVRDVAVHTAAHRFGDAFAPAVSEVALSGESLVASGSTPAAGAFALAQSALDAALAQSILDAGLAGPVDATTDEAHGAGPMTTVFDPDIEFAALLTGGAEPVPTGESAD